MTDRLLQQSARLARFLHARGVLGPTASGAVRKAAGRLANQGTRTYKNAWGHLVEADLADYSERAGFFGALSPGLIRAITELLRPGDWAIDAGANVGLMSSPMAAAVGSSGRVWSIEPLPRNVARLERLKTLNGLGQLRVFPVALGAASTTARLRLSADPGGSGWASFVSPWAGQDYVDVPTCPLDELVEAASAGPTLRLVKVDLEGYEAEMLKGATNTLTTYRPYVVCEFHDPLLRAAGSSSQELLDSFTELGYSPQPPFDRPVGSLDGKVVDLLLGPRRT